MAGAGQRTWPPGRKPTARNRKNYLRRLADRLGLTFVEHDSLYRGGYLIAHATPHRIEIQPNAIPGDDGQDDRYDDEHPDVRTLLPLSGPHRDAALIGRLDSIDHLVVLRRETA